MRTMRSPPPAVVTRTSVPPGPSAATAEASTSRRPAVTGWLVTVRSGVSLSLWAWACTSPWKNATSAATRTGSRVPSYIHRCPRTPCSAVPSSPSAACGPGADR
jgi:hypothetical protein